MGEAESHLKEAEKALSTGFFKRKPDYDTAAMSFENAAKAFQYARQYKEAIEAYMKASDAHCGADNLYFGAKCIENSALILVKELKDSGGAAVLYVRASDLYRRNNNGERAIEQLEKAGKVMESSGHVNNAIRYYLDACDLYEAEDRLRIGMETFRNVVSLQLKSGQLQDAIKYSHHVNEEVLAKVEGKHMTKRGFLSTIILVLAMGDEVEASKLFEKYSGLVSGWPSSDEGELANVLLTGFEQRDQSIIEEVLKKQLLTFLDNEVVKIARTLRVAGAITLDEAAVIRPNPDVSTALCDDLPTAAPPSTDETNELC